MGLFVLKENKEINNSNMILSLDESYTLLEEAINEYEVYTESELGRFHRDAFGNEVISHYDNNDKATQSFFNRHMNSLGELTGNFESIKKDYRDLDKSSGQGILNRIVVKLRNLYTKTLYKLKKAVHAKEAGILKRIAHAILNFIDRILEKAERATFNKDKNKQTSNASDKFNFDPKEANVDNNKLSQIAINLEKTKDKMEKDLDSVSKIVDNNISKEDRDKVADDLMKGQTLEYTKDGKIYKVEFTHDNFQKIMNDPNSKLKFTL